MRHQHEGLRLGVREAGSEADAHRTLFRKNDIEV